MGKAFERMTAEAAEPPTTRMLERANAIWPFSTAAGILDDGSGPGQIMSQLLKAHGSDLPADCELQCTDISDGVIQQVLQKKADAVREDAESVWQRVQCSMQDAMDLKDVASESQSHVLAGFVSLSRYMAQATKALLTHHVRFRSSS